MARVTMAALIGRVRKMIGNPSSSLISDDDIQTVLDLDINRRNVVFAPLDALPTINTSSQVEYKEFTAPMTVWEGEGTGSGGTLPKLQDANGTDLRSGVSDENLWNGKWVFSTEKRNGVYVTGAVYDINGAAADLMKHNVALANDDYDVTIHDKTFRRSQRRQSRETLIAMYEAARWSPKAYYPSAGVQC